jgi:ribonuclease-3 family protein
VYLILTRDEHGCEGQQDKLQGLMDLGGKILSPTEVVGLSPLVLAYIGDAVFELWIRLRLVQSGCRRMYNLHRRTVRWVNAVSQARILEKWAPVLSEQEAEIVRRGRNTKSAVPRGTTVADYRLSTGLEALVGYLYLAGEEKRLLELLLLAAETDLLGNSEKA